MKLGPQLRHLLGVGLERVATGEKPRFERLIIRLARACSFLTPDIPFSPDLRYYRWLRRHYPRRRELSRMARESNAFSFAPLISIVMPVRDPPVEYLRAAIDSVCSQAYPRWELCIVDDGTTDERVRALLRDFERADPRIHSSFNRENSGIAASTNTAMEMARGEFIALLDHDDILLPHAMYRVVELLNEHPDADLVYSDEDKLDSNGEIVEPFFKPDWCPDSFLSRMYLCHLMVLRRATVEHLGGFRREYEGGHLYDLVLRLSEESDRIYHVPDVLYRGRHSSSTVHEADHRALQAALNRRGEEAETTPVSETPGFHRVRYKIKERKLVSIIIPSKDQGATLNRCVSSIFQTSSYPHFEVILVDNGTTEASARDVLASWTKKEPKRFLTIRLDVPFNFSLLCNAGVRRSAGHYLLFLNNDTEVITPDWLEAMMEQAQRPSIGAVGALQLYENGTIQHAGAILGLGGLAAHSHRGVPGNSVGYAGQLISVNNYLSVAASCLMCRKELFEELGRFDEQLPGDYEDVDLCLRMVEKGYRNVCLPHVRLYHHESRSRGKDYAKRNRQQQKKAAALIRSRWSRYIKHDPCYSPNLTRDSEDYRII